MSSHAGNELSIDCKGKAIGYDVELSSKTVNFGEVQVDGSTNRLLNVINSSDLPTTFQFITDPNNVFSFSVTTGTVKPMSSVRVIITFNPTRTGNTYERIFCMVKNHKVLYVDLMGTCFDILTKPIPLTQRHIDTHRQKVIMGAHNKKVKDVDVDADGEDSIMESAIEIDYLERPMDDPSQVVLHKEMLQSATADTRDIKFSAESLEFGFCDNGRLSDAK